jgi:cytidine deaminase
MNATLPIDDDALIEAARAAIRARYQYGRHHVGSAVRMRSGRVFTGLHLETHVGGGVCAEAVALGRAACEGEDEIDTIVAVRHPKPGELPRDIAVVSPCGTCRELVADYGPAARVIVPTAEGPRPVSIAELLPWKYLRPGTGA